MVAVNLVDGDNVSGLTDLSADELAIDTNKFFPAVGTAISGVDRSSTVINEENPEMPAGVFTSCCKSGMVLREIDDVVNLDFINFDGAHGTPPFFVIVAMRAPRFWIEPS